MHDHFDDKLSGRIRDVFENFEDDTADLGWQELRKKFPGEVSRQKPVFAWWWQSAAVLLLALGTWAYFTRTDTKIYLTGKAHTEIRNKPEQAPSGESGLKASSDIAENTEVFAATEAGVSKEVSSSYMARRKNNPGSPKKSLNGIAAATSPTLVSADEKDIETVAREEQRVVSAQAQQGPDTARISTQKDKVTELEKIMVADLLAHKKTKEKTLADLAPEPEKQPSQPEKAERKVKVGIAAGSYLSYAKGSEGSVNTGVGILSDIPLTKKLKLSTGVSIAQNSFKFGSSIPEAATAVFNSSVAMKEEASPANDKSFGMPNLIAYNPNTYSLSNYSASLLGLDLPVNLRYSVFKKKNELYMSAGLSSNFFIEESYSYSYQINSGTNSTTQHEDDEAAKSRFQNFDFARMLNFSIGFEQPLTKQTQLSFEPFIKYPLGGQGERDIRFGSVGLNLKLNLSKSTDKRY